MEPDAIAWVDGACEPTNPGGTGGIGFVIKEPTGELITSGYSTLRARPTMTNNFAEYACACAAVRAYKDLDRPGPLEVRGDSMLVTKQMRGEWRVRGGHYVKARESLLELLETCNFEVTWIWVSRDQNEEADALSIKGLKELGIQRRRYR